MTVSSIDIHIDVDNSEKGIGIIKVLGKSLTTMVVTDPHGSPTWINLEINEREELINALIKTRRMDKQ